MFKQPGSIYVNEYTWKPWIYAPVIIGYSNIISASNVHIWLDKHKLQDTPQLSSAMILFPENTWWKNNNISGSPSNFSQLRSRPNFFQPSLSYYSHLSVVLLSNDSRSTLLRLDRRKKWSSCIDQNSFHSERSSIFAGPADRIRHVLHAYLERKSGILLVLVLPVQIFLRLSSICYHTRPNFSQSSSRIALLYQLFCCRTREDQVY